MRVDPPTVSVIIPAADAADSLPRAIESIRAQDYPNIIETVVAAADPTTAACARGRSSVVDNPSGSTPAGLNLAWRASTGSIIVRCDAQSVLPANYVTRAVATLMRVDAQNVGGRQIPVGATSIERAIAAAMGSPFGSGGARYRHSGEEGPVETVYLGVFPRPVLEELGGFDESFIRTQDYELNHRIINAGGIVWFDPALAVEYTPRSSLRALAKQYFEYGIAKRQFGRRHRGALRWRQALPPLLVSALALSVMVSTLWPAALLVTLAYLLATLTAAVAARGSPLTTTAALVTMHISWGSGFLIGRRRRS